LNTLKIVLAEFAQSPLKTISGFVRRLAQEFKVPARVLELRKIVREAPLILQIETINVCNAACIFCAYPGMKRKKGVMSLALFEKIVKEYAAMGGGAVSLTPLVGDALLDPHLKERFRILDRHPEINQVTLTTNAIALDRYSDEDVRFLLEKLYCIQVSIGGLDPATYRTMYGVDKFPQVQEAMERLLILKDKVPNAADITFAFRTNDRKFENRYKRQIDEYRKRGAFVSHMWMYANYSGVVKNDEARNLVVLNSWRKKRNPCVYASVAMSICWDGRITACGCTDYEGEKLTIGHVEQDILSEVWSGRKRTGILDSFERRKVPPVCQRCSAYQPDSIFASPCFNEATPHRPLPLDFFHQVWGG
jgi:radical SAM protein with 4Fe4S-binding SPASM domain